MMDSQEQWRSIAGFPGYQVSDLGRVRSFRRGGLLDARILRPSRANKQKRAIVTLYMNRSPSYRLVSRLVCDAFHGAPPSATHQAAHGNNDPTDDRASNLSWKLPVENAADRAFAGHTARGIVHHAAKLWPDEVIDIRRRYAAAKASGRLPRGFFRRIATEFSAPISRIEDVVYGRKWRHITESGVILGESK